MQLDGGDSMSSCAMRSLLGIFTNFRSFLVLLRWFEGVQFRLLRKHIGFEGIIEDLVGSDITAQCQKR